MKQVWQQQYVYQEAAIRWRNKDDLPAPADTISTPYDPQVRYSRKREMTWMGYKVHLTETCQTVAPHLITQVELITVEFVCQRCGRPQVYTLYPGPTPKWCFACYRDVRRDKARLRKRRQRARQKQPDTRLGDE